MIWKESKFEVVIHYKPGYLAKNRCLVSSNKVLKMSHVQGKQCYVCMLQV